MSPKPAMRDWVQKTTRRYRDQPRGTRSGAPIRSGVPVHRVVDEHVMSVPNGFDPTDTVALRAVLVGPDGPTREHGVSMLHTLLRRVLQQP